MDEFKPESSRYWAISHDWISLDTYYAYVSKYNVKRLAANPLGVLQIEFKNDCYGMRCQIKHSGEYTPFTTGKISSLSLFGYGVYKFRALATQDASHDLWTLPEVVSVPEDIEVMSCFSLVNDKTSITSLKMSICVSNKNPNAVVTSLVAGAYSSHITSLIPFDASKHIRVYKIEYHPCHVKFMIGEELIRKISAETVNIPYEGVRITMGLYPYMQNMIGQRHPKYLQLEDRSHIEFRMRVYMVSYSENFIHDEPLTHDYSSPKSPFLYIIIILCILFLSGYCTTRLYYTFMQNLDDHYFLMKECGESNSNDSLL